MISEHIFLVLHIISVAVSLVMLGATIKWPNVGRFLFVLLFLWAGYINSSTAISSPEEYLNYGNLAWLEFYEDFIHGFFGQHITLIVLLIAACQFAIGILLATKGSAVKWACWAAIIFLLALTPLGVGSGFPTTVIMAIAMWVISRKQFDLHLWEVVKRKLGHKETDQLQPKAKL